MRGMPRENGEAIGMPSWAAAGLEALTQEKGEAVPQLPLRDSYIAGFTCEDCPNIFRPMRQCICELIEPPEGYEGGWDSGMDSVAHCRPRNELNEAIGCGEPVRFTERCRSCANKIRRWGAGRRDITQLEKVCWARAHSGRSWSLVFLTLTQPNTAAGAELAPAVRAFKKDVASWRRSVGVAEHFLGGIDYYEVTENKEDSSMNIHVHGVWVMKKFWPQGELQDSWARGIAHIKKVKDSKRAIRYVTAYLAKAPIAGVRTKERWGRCRGAAFAAIEELHQTVVIDAPDVLDVSD